MCGRVFHQRVFHHVHLFPSPRWRSLAMTSSQVRIRLSRAGAQGNRCPSCRSDPIRDSRQLSIFPLCFFFSFFTSLGFNNALRPPGQRPHRLKSQRAYAHGCSRAQFKQRLVDRSDAISPVETHIWCPIAGGTVKKKKEWRNRDREKAREVKKKGGSEDQHQDQLYLHCSILNANVASVTSKGICGDILETEN